MDEFKAMVEKKVTLPAARQRLVFNAKQMESGKISDYGKALVVSPSS